jgi:hypothetical protein
MTAVVFQFPGTHRRDVDEDRAKQIAERVTANLGGENPGDCADALLRVLAATCCVNTINATEAIETAQLMALDLETLVRGIVAPEAPADGDA